MLERLARPRYEIFPFAGIADAVAEQVPREVKVTVTSSPRRGVEATIALSVELAARGFEVVPHLSARLIEDERQLREILERLRAAGVHEAFVPAGDIDRPAGKFGGAAELLGAMAELGHPFDAIGITGYPESHPFISDEITIKAMFDKAPFASYIVSQLCLDPEVIVWWIGAVRERGVELPIYVGIPGAVQRRKLVQIAARIGVGESRRFLGKHGSVLGRMLLRGAFSPGRLLESLAPHVDDPRNGIAGFHVYTFNQLERTERWRQELLASG